VIHYISLRAIFQLLDHITNRIRVKTAGFINWRFGTPIDSDIEIIWLCG